MSGAVPPEDLSAFAESDHLAAIDLDDSSLPPAPVELAQERQVALYDLVEGNRFQLAEASALGPYRLRLTPAERRLQFDLTTEVGEQAGAFALPLSGLRGPVRAYLEMCEAYRDAVKRLAPSQIEKIDEDRRQLHSEGAATLAEKMAPHARVDRQTARRLFTLVCHVMRSP